MSHVECLCVCVCVLNSYPIVVTSRLHTLMNYICFYRFKIQLREKIADVLPAFENAMVFRCIVLLLYVVMSL